MRLVDEHARVVAQPVMSEDAFEGLKENSHLFGHHKEKQRLTLQHPDLIKASETGTAWGLFLVDVLELVRTRRDCQLVNFFININRGERAPTAAGGHDNAGGFHVDNPTENGEPWPNMARFLFYWMLPEELGSICIRVKGAAIELSAPPGFGLLLSNVLLDLSHRHAAHGRSISFVIEVSVFDLVGATEAEVTAASNVQPQLDLLGAFGDWDGLAARAVGPKRKWNQTGTGTARRNAVAYYWGIRALDGRRKMTRVAARLLVKAMKPEEIQACSAKYFKSIGHLALDSALGGSQAALRLRGILDHLPKSGRRSFFRSLSGRHNGHLNARRNFSLENISASLNGAI